MLNNRRNMSEIWNEIGGGVSAVLLVLALCAAFHYEPIWFAIGIPLVFVFAFGVAYARGQR